MVYLMLIQAGATGSPGEGALLIAAFGAGTLPALLGIGLFAGLTGPVADRRSWRRAAGAVLVLLDVVQAGLPPRQICSQAAILALPAELAVSFR